MEIKTLRKMVREEVNAALDEKFVVDSHTKFRSLVEAKSGRKFVDTDDNWTVTYAAWSDLLSECVEGSVDQETLDYYVYVAATTLKG